MGPSNSLTSTQNTTSTLVSKKRLLFAVVFGLIAIALSYLLGQANTTNQFVTQYIIATTAIYIVLTPFRVLR